MAFDPADHPGATQGSRLVMAGFSDLFMGPRLAPVLTDGERGWNWESGKR
jgi:hypothetical protein